MVAKYRINNFKYIRINHHNKVDIEDVDVEFLKKLNKDEMIILTDKLINNYKSQTQELSEAYKEIVKFREEIRLTKYKTTKSENKLVEVLLDYHLATRKLLK